MTAPPPTIADPTVLRPIERGAHGEMWLIRNVIGMLWTVKILLRAQLPMWDFAVVRATLREFGLDRGEQAGRAAWIPPARFSLARGGGVANDVFVKDFN